MTSFLITGATGRLGRLALDTLLAQPTADDIRVLIRRESDAGAFARLGVSPRIGTYDDPASLRAAFAGIDRLLFVSSPVLDPATRSMQHASVVDAAAEVGTDHVVYTSAMGGEHDPGHASTEAALAASGLGHTILRNALYTEPFVIRALTDAGSGVVRSASRGERLATASLRDLAEAAARALVDPPAAVVQELRGPAWSFPELADEISRLWGRRVTHRRVDDSDTGEFAPLFPLVRRGAFAIETGDLARLLGRAPRSIREVVAAEATPRAR